MPELPEVETIAAGVHARVHGARIARVWHSEKPQTFKSPAEEIARALTGVLISSVRRVGKTIVMTVERKKSSTEFLIHLGMTGRLLVSAPDVPLATHTHMILTLDDGRQIRFVDPRRFGRLSLQPADTPYTGPGSEPLTISQSDFSALFHPRHTPIKAALLNQSLLHGVGNIYADEALFRSSVRPTRLAASLTRIELTCLRTSLLDVLRQAIQLGGSSVSDYVDADGARGFFQLEHRVYQRTNQPCLVFKSPIRRIVLAGRSTHFCSHCQK